MSIVTYPKLPKDEPKEVQPSQQVQAGVADVNTFRLTNITQIQRELEQDLAKYSKTKRTYSSIYNAISYTNTGASTVVTLATGTSVGLATTGVGAPIALTLGFVSLALGACSLALSAANKKIMPKLQKHTAIVQLITAKLSSFRLITSKALEDSNITDEEFNRLQADYADYKRQKFDLKKKMGATFSQPTQDLEAIKKECLKQVNETLNSVLKR
jgi:hypothetical protein